MIVIHSKERYTTDKLQGGLGSNMYVDSAEHDYYVKDEYHVRRSESALVLFAHACSREELQQRVVIKILCDYEDSRYSLKEPQKRIECQLQALQWNQKFTPNLYLGIGCVLDPDLETLKQKSFRSIRIGEIITKSEDFPIIAKEDANYALIMECLPKERRLDLLLKKKSSFAVKRLLSALVERVVHMHKRTCLPTDVYVDDDGKHWAWGSYQQLEKKLRHNINLFENLQSLPDKEIYRQYSWLKDALQMTIESPLLANYFETRQRYIKRCHGDLKARNIWINALPANNNGDDEQYVRVLDAIDFNPSYCNIDVLSDIAMLAVDVQAIDTQLHEYNSSPNRSQMLADFIIKEYLALSNYKTFDLQEKKVVETLLAYYMLEKAIVRGAVSLYFDRSDYPHLGRYFLDIAVERMSELDQLLETSIMEKCYPQRVTLKV